MTRTKRIYNTPKSPWGYWVSGGIGWVTYWHPYRQSEAGPQSGEHKSEHAKQRRITYRKYLLNELKHICYYEHFNECAKCCFYVLDLDPGEVCKFGY